MFVLNSKGRRRKPGFQPRPTYRRRPWTAEEEDTLRDLYPTTSKAEIARRLDRTVNSVVLKAQQLDVDGRYVVVNDRYLDTLRRLNADGYTDPEIARELDSNVFTVRIHRTKLGLPHQVSSARRRARSAASIRAAHARFVDEAAVRTGWPPGLRRREYQVLDALAANGPMTRQEICEVVGHPWHGPATLFGYAKTGGPYLFNLTRLGLVVNLGKVSPPGEGGQRLCNLYSLALGAERSDV